MTSKASPVGVMGPLAAHVDGFRGELTRWGYTPLSAANQLRVMADLSRWLASRELRADDLTVERVEAFLEARRAEGYTCWLSQRGLAPLLGYLRGLGVAPTPVTPVVATPLEALLAGYHAYLVDERGLALATVRHHESVARFELLDVDPAHHEADQRHHLIQRTLGPSLEHTPSLPTGCDNKALSHKGSFPALAAG